MKRKYDQISPVMEYLHRLPIWERINYKVLLLTYKSLDGLAPQFLSDLLERRPECSTRRDNKNLLVNPQVRTITFGDRAFKKAACPRSMEQHTRLTLPVHQYQTA